MASAPNPARSQQAVGGGPRGRRRPAPSKTRQSDARWRASLQACYSLLRPVLQSRQPVLSRAPKPLVLEATRQHLLELEQALAMLLDMKNTVIQSLFDGPATSLPRLTVEQYKALFLGLYPLEAGGAEAARWDGEPAMPPPPPAAPCGPAGDAAPVTAPDLADLARLLHEAYDASEDQPPPAASAAGVAEGAAQTADGAGGEPRDFAPHPLPDVEETLCLDLPSLEVSSVWSECSPEPAGSGAGWQDLEQTVQSLSVPAQLDHFTKIQRSDWVLNMPSVPAPPPSHLSPLSPEMALPAFCSTPDDEEAAPHALVTPPPGTAHAKRSAAAAAAAAAAARRRADRCRRTLGLL